MQNRSYMRFSERRAARFPHGNGPRREPRDFTLRAVIAAAVAGVTVLIFISLWFAFHIILLVFTGILLAVLLRGLAGWVRSYTRLPIEWSLTAVILLFLAIIGMGFFLLIPYVTNQADELQGEIQSSWKQVQTNISMLPMGKTIVHRLSNLDELLGKGGSFKQIKSIFGFTLETITEFIILLFIGLYLAYNPGLYLNGALRLVPPAFRPRLRYVLDKTAYTLRWWLLGISLDMAIVGVLTGLGLWLLGVPLPALLGIISGALTFIPTFGLLISIVPALLLAMTGGMAKVFYVIILYLAAHAIEAYVVGPLVQQKMVALPPAVMILGLLVFGYFFGILGLMVVTPIVAAL
ncbi:MAG TPA: AI-2E family transporter, partial [Thermodesulfobacteriota bacterium]|nr:AI-2E family transporter [Thermodesulfobacteriota bacterium]